MPRGDYLGEFEEIVLLAVARLDGEAYGMTIWREIEVRTGRAVSIGAVYATVERLEDKGFVVVGEGDADPSRDGRARRFFTVTPSGASAPTPPKRCAPAFAAVEVAPQFPGVDMATTIRPHRSAPRPPPAGGPPARAQPLGRRRRARRRVAPRARGRGRVQGALVVLAPGDRLHPGGVADAPSRSDARPRFRERAQGRRDGRRRAAGRQERLARPGFAAAAILTMAVGIGANVATFSIVDAVVFRPLPYPRAASLVRVWSANPRGILRNALSPPDYFDMRDGAPELDALAAFTQGDAITLGPASRDVWWDRASRPICSMSSRFGRRRVARCSRRHHARSAGRRRRERSVRAP